jgi:hypothetical protein
MSADAPARLQRAIFKVFDRFYPAEAMMMVHSVLHLPVDR